MYDNSVFDHKASTYDTEFTNSYVGKIQRERIQEFVRSRMNGKGNLEILELNCGTGEDISFLQEFGNVTATDVSEEMLKIAMRKNSSANIHKMDLNHPVEFDKKFDFIFSNFGGLNCIAPERLAQLNFELKEILKPDGQMFLVMMHRWSMMEFLYFLVKLKFKKALRRLRRKSYFGSLPIYYYSKREIASLFSSFKCISTLPVGVLLSGEYMNSLGKRIGIIEGRTKWLSPVMGADHFLFNFISEV